MKLLEYLKNNKTYIIAEMSGNHGGDINNAINIIKASAEAGADCVKIQTYTKDTITINCNNEEFWIKEGIWNKERLYDLYGKAYTPWDWTERLKSESEKLGLDFLSTPFDFSAVNYLERCKLEFYKIASFEIIDIPLIKRVALTGKPVIMSCGMASEKEILEAIDTFKKYSEAELVLLKCCSAYPSNYDDMNISTIKDMKEKYNVNIGLSDHSSGSIASIVAVANGACVIEKHICLNKSVKTVDSDFSLSKEEFKQLVCDIRNAAKAFGVPTYGPSKNEMESYRCRRSLYVVKDIKKGEKFTSENIKSIRPANGLHTRYYDFLIKNGHAKCDIKFGSPLNENVICEKLEVM